MEKTANSGEQSTLWIGNVLLLSCQHSVAVEDRTNMEIPVCSGRMCQYEHAGTGFAQAGCATLSMLEPK